MIVNETCLIELLFSDSSKFFIFGLPVNILYDHYTYPHYNKGRKVGAEYFSVSRGLS